MLWLGDKSLTINKHCQDFSKEIHLMPVHCVSGFEGGIILWECTFTRVNAALSTSASVAGWHSEKLENQFRSWLISPADILVSFVSKSLISSCFFSIHLVFISWILIPWYPLVLEEFLGLK